MSKKKPAGELTTEGLARRLFPKKVRDKVKEETREKSKVSKKKPSTKGKGR